MKDGWRMSVRQIYGHVKEFIGRENVYKIVDEAISAGYIERVHNKVGNLRQGVTYYVSESPIFKKSFRRSDPQDADSQDPPDQEALSSTKSSSYEEAKEEIHKEGPPSAPPSAEASTLCEFFLSKIKERNPEFKEPSKKEKWIKEFDAILRIDNRAPERLKELISWASTHKWWSTACLCPNKLRKRFDEMSMQMQGDAKNANIAKNRSHALKLKEQFPDKLKALSFDTKFARNLSMSKEIPFDLPEETFKRALVEMFGGQYVGR
jgi:hypothetical protein